MLVEIDYTNFRGERAVRRIGPVLGQFSVAKDDTGYHPGQWVLVAMDVDKGAKRSFAMASIHAWREIEAPT